jgi:multicomponent Na+:H+ antiporter subunit D
VSALLPLAVAIPIALAAAAALAGGRLALARLLGLAGAVSMLAIATALLWATRDGEVVVAQIGGWPPPFAIPLAVDTFAALMLAVSGLMVVVCTGFAIARREDERPFFHPLVLVLAAGVTGAFLTADLFNLFVFVEVMLIASYVLMALGGSRAQIRAGAIYVAANLFASTLFLTSVALMYAVAGTVNLAQLAGAAGAPGTAAIAGVLILAALGVKASLVPVHGWLPRTYPFAPPAVAALFSGLLTKVGVYAVYRVYSIVFEGQPSLRGPLLLVACLTMAIGVLGAVGRGSMRDILSFHMVSQVGYLLLAAGLFGAAGLAAGVFFMVQYIVVKTSLFLSAGAVETLEGTGTLDRLGGLVRRRPLLAAAFAVSALSLAGIPPLSGFVAKLALVRVAFDEQAYWAAGVAVGVSFLTLLSMVKIWNGVFWGKPREPEPGGDRAPSRRRSMGVVAPAAATAVLTLVLGIGAQGLWLLADQAGEGLADPAPYVQAVLP